MSSGPIEQPPAPESGAEQEQAPVDEHGELMTPRTLAPPTMNCRPGGRSIGLPIDRVVRRPCSSSGTAVSDPRGARRVDSSAET